MRASLAEVLDCPLEDNDAGADTIRGYLIALLATLWVEGEGFGGKRPFGNSGWEYELYYPLVKHGFIPGQIHEEGWLEDVDKDAGYALIEQAIQYLGRER